MDVQGLSRQFRRYITEFVEQQVETESQKQDKVDKKKFARMMMKDKFIQDVVKSSITQIQPILARHIAQDNQIIKNFPIKQVLARRLDDGYIQLKRRLNEFIQKGNPDNLQDDQHYHQLKQMLQDLDGKLEMYETELDREINVERSQFLEKVQQNSRNKKITQILKQVSDYEVPFIQDITDISVSYNQHDTWKKHIQVEDMLKEEMRVYEHRQNIMGNEFFYKLQFVKEKAGLKIQQLEQTIEQKVKKYENELDRALMTLNNSESIEYERVIREEESLKRATEKEKYRDLPSAIKKIQELHKGIIIMERKLDKSNKDVRLYKVKFNELRNVYSDLQEKVKSMKSEKDLIVYILRCILEFNRIQENDKNNLRRWINKEKYEKIEQKINNQNIKESRAIEAITYRINDIKTRLQDLSTKTTDKDTSFKLFRIIADCKIDDVLVTYNQDPTDQFLAQLIPTGLKSIMSVAPKPLPPRRNNVIKSPTGSNASKKIRTDLSENDESSAKSSKQPISLLAVPRNSESNKSSPAGSVKQSPLPQKKNSMQETDESEESEYSEDESDSDISEPVIEVKKQPARVQEKSKQILRASPAKKQPPVQPKPKLPAKKSKQQVKKLEISTNTQSKTSNELLGNDSFLQITETTSQISIVTTPEYTIASDDEIQEKEENVPVIDVESQVNLPPVQFNLTLPSTIQQTEDNFLTHRTEDTQPELPVMRKDGESDNLEAGALQTDPSFGSLKQKEPQWYDELDKQVLIDQTVWNLEFLVKNYSQALQKGVVTQQTQTHKKEPIDKVPPQPNDLGPLIKSVLTKNLTSEPPLFPPQKPKDPLPQKIDHSLSIAEFLQKTGTFGSYTAHGIDDIKVGNATLRTRIAFEEYKAEFMVYARKSGFKRVSVEQARDLWEKIVDLRVNANKTDDITNFIRSQVGTANFDDQKKSLITLILSENKENLIRTVQHLESPLKAPKKLHKRKANTIALNN